MLCKNYSVSLQKQGVSLQNYSVSLQKHGVSLQKQGVSLQKHGVSLQKVLILLTVQLEFVFEPLFIIFLLFLIKK